MTDLERFHRKYTVAPTGCWLWSGCLDRDGYAAFFKVGSRTDGSRSQKRPHRWIYEQLVGPIGAGLVIDHKCRARACVNPAHMEAVTTQENTRRGARANATHCKSGHPLVGDNLYQGKTQRACMTCRRRWASEHGKRTGWAAQKAYRERVKSESATN